AEYLKIRMEERINERTRIARDLHDTLLQSFQGVLLKFHAVQFLIRNRPAEAEKILEEVIEQAQSAITEGRDAVQGLRTSTLISTDLASTIGALGDQLCADQSGDAAPAFRIQVEGVSRSLLPLVRDEIYRIAAESLRNAFRHAGARQIEVEIHYEPREFRLRI